MTGALSTAVTDGLIADLINEVSTETNYDNRGLIKELCGMAETKKKDKSRRYKELKELISDEKL